ncbi:unnamed protein product [Phytophthora fragariaefolia]|uniref:Unnamed protein product n=1 Tax=Phytophthora fragariaefolia TaxID=1490495 RepID=A0A9W6XQQ7_9STRA|nr:unnamed protein product [Phytophthora fragariaefolia]
MPRKRIPTRYTNRFKASAVEDWQEAKDRGVSRVEFAKSRGFPRLSLQNWERNGRKAETTPIEDTLCVFIKDERRLEHTVTVDFIIDMATELMPDVMGSKSPEAKKSWCQRFMRRHSLTIRICHSGRKTREELETLRFPFVKLVTQHVTEHCYYDPNTSLTVARALFNMDQTFVYWDMGTRTTVEFIGAPTVRSTSNESEGYRCTMALTVAADGRVLPPHFVYNGVPGGDVEKEVNSLCLGDVATFSGQESAWFNDRVMLEWIDKCWKPIVVEPSVLILDSLSVHKMAKIADALACTAPRPKQVTPAYRRREIFERAMEGLRFISADTVKNSFHKAGPFMPYGPPNNAADSPIAWSRDSVVDYTEIVEEVTV